MRGKIENGDCFAVRLSKTKLLLLKTEKKHRRKMILLAQNNVLPLEQSRRLRFFYLTIVKIETRISHHADEAKKNL